jgi:transposase
MISQNTSKPSLPSPIKFSQSELQMKSKEELIGDVTKLSGTVNELIAQIAWFRRQMFGSKSEKLAAYDPNQLRLFTEEEAQQLAQAEEQSKEAVQEIENTPQNDKKQAKRNRKLLEDLPVLERVVIEPEGVDLSSYKKIGEEVTRTLEFTPGKLYIKEYVRPVYGLKDSISLPPDNQKSVEIAPMPLLPIHKGIAGPTLLAEVLLQKYQYHLPFYRQIQQFAHLGVRHLTENTIDGWFAPTIQLLKPLYKVLEAEVFKHSYLQVDETTVPVVDKVHHKTNKEYLWMVRDVEQRLVLFYYEDGSRAGAVIKKLAENFKGYLQCDGFVGYTSAFNASSDVQLVNCMAHIRRQFEQALNENKEVASYVLKQIQYLYQVEHWCNDQDVTPEVRQQERDKKSRPIMTALKVWMETEGIKYSPSSLIGKAVTYAYNRWDNMMHYLDDGRIYIDNNLAENAIRPITLGRKNYLFCGNHEAAINMSVVCSLLSTCREHHVNPRDYLNDVIARMPYMKEASYDELLQLLPHNWKPLKDSDC